VKEAPSHAPDRLLRSLEEFLYELIGWFVFHPRTFMRILFRPGTAATYVRSELTKDVNIQFQDAISPVLIMILSVGVAYLVELAIEAPLPETTSPTRRLLFGTDQGILLTDHSSWSGNRYELVIEHLFTNGFQ
jgi:hypothetical protein